MKKIFKLILLFSVIVGGYVGIQFIDVHPGPIDGHGTDETTFKKYGELYLQEWSSVAKWDEKMFESHMSEIQEKYEMAYLTEYQRNLLVENVCTYAINKLDSVLCAEWKKSNCKRENINSQYQGVDTVANYLKGDARVNKLQGIKKNYDKIYSLIRSLNHKTLGAEPKVNDDYSWESFEATASKKKKDANKYREMSDYKTYFSNIAEIKSNISSDNVESVIKKASINYYSQIAMALVNKFSEDWKNAVNAKDSSALDKLMSLMTNRQDLLSKEHMGYKPQSEQVKSYNDFVYSKKAEGQDLIELWEKEKLINEKSETLPNFNLR